VSEWTKATVRLRSERLAWRRAGDEVIALDLERSEYLSVNATAAHLWEALSAGANRAQLVRLLCTYFDVAPEIAGADVDLLLEQLDEAGLLVTQY
jgi:hypothetical protein